MFNWLKKKEPIRQFEPRDLFFGDLPITEWAKDTSLQSEPHVSFIEARKHLEAKNNKSAIAALQKITGMPNLESRHYLQAWCFLRGLGVNPPTEISKTVYGVVIEVGTEMKVDIVAAYADFTARYLGKDGSLIVWERPNNYLDAEIDALLKAGQVACNQIGPWEGPRPPAPTIMNVRLNMLTPGGLNFGYGGFQTLSNDPMGKPLMDSATQLRTKMFEMVKK